MKLYTARWLSTYVFKVLSDCYPINRIVFPILVSEKSDSSIRFFGWRRDNDELVKPYVAGALSLLQLHRVTSLTYETASCVARAKWAIEETWESLGIPILGMGNATRTLHLQTFSGRVILHFTFLSSVSHSGWFRPLRVSFDWWQSSFLTNFEGQSSSHETLVWSLSFHAVVVLIIYLDSIEKRTTVHRDIFIVNFRWERHKESDGPELKYNSKNRSSLLVFLLDRLEYFESGAHLSDRSPNLLFPLLSD